MFDYLENVAFAATVCNREGVVLYQNKTAQQRDGDAVGKNLFNCHTQHTNEKIRHMLANGVSNTYETIQDGRRSFVHHTPWYETPGGEVSGLIELEIAVPDTHPVINRDKV